MKECLKCKSKKDDIEFKPKSFKCKSCISEYQKLYREKNKEKSKDYFERYYLNNRESFLEKAKEYVSENKEKVAEYKKNHVIDNKEKYKEYNHNYYLENKERLLSKNKIYQSINKDNINIKRNIRNKENREVLNNKIKERRKSDPIFRISQNIRVYIRNCFRYKGVKKNTKTENILGCSFMEFKIHLESKFEPWMNWDNYGKYNGDANSGWDIDHIIPLSTAKTENDIYRLNHYTNLQPLCSYINRYIKKDNYDCLDEVIWSLSIS
jgi:hypothetical protein